MYSTTPLAHTQTRGFTIVEILIAIAISLMLVAVTVTAFGSFRDYFALRAAVQDTHTALIDARGATLASKGDTVHGVHIEPSQVVRFQGPTYNAGAVSNIYFPFPGTVSATSSLTSGSTDILFTRLTGSAQTSGTITLTESRSGNMATITINGSGLIEL